MPVETIASEIAQLGIAGIFVWLYINKDRAHQNLQNKLVNVIKEQTEMNGELKNVIEKNTIVADKTLLVTEAVYKELLGRGSK